MHRQCSYYVLRVHCAAERLYPSPNRVPGVPLIVKNWKANYSATGMTTYINPAAFSVPGSQGNPQIGDTARDMSDGRTPREFTFDARFVKGFTIRDRYRLSVNGTFVNALNHPLYGELQNGSTGHGYLSATTGNTSGALAGAVTNTVNPTFGTMGGGSNRNILVGAEINF
jgi:hypothetical protein